MEWSVHMKQLLTIPGVVERSLVRTYQVIVEKLSQESPCLEIPASGVDGHCRHHMLLNSIIWSILAGPISGGGSDQARECPEPKRLTTLKSLQSQGWSGPAHKQAGRYRLGSSPWGQFIGLKEDITNQDQSNNHLLQKWAPGFLVQLVDQLINWSIHIYPFLRNGTPVFQ